MHGAWVTDIQRFAYVLAPGETQPPKAALEKWEKGKKGSRVALAAMKPGVRGYDVDKAQRDWMREAGSRARACGAPGTRWATGRTTPGPALSGAQTDEPPVRRAPRAGCIPGRCSPSTASSAGSSTREARTHQAHLSVEEMAVVTETGAEYLIPPQEDLILIPSR